MSAPTSAVLNESVREADLRTLLMTLYHYTGDREWLEPPFSPKRDVRLIPDPGAGLPADVQEQIRACAVTIFSKKDRKPAIRDPGDATLQKMMSVCTGENVPAEYVPMVREEMGLSSRTPSWRGQPDPQTLASFSVLIVGAGASGISLAATLGQLGIPYTIVEQRDEVGGAWYANQYPGCGVDTPNHCYSYSFGKRFPWSRYFARREEVQRYLTGIVSDLGIRDHIRFETRFAGARWDESARCWRSTVENANGRQEIVSRFLIAAVGQLSDPAIAKLSGWESFRGRVFHPAEWPKDLDLTGKRVAIVGTGATAMQLAPAIADIVRTLTIYQRSPQWVRPVEGYDKPIPPGQRLLLETIPEFAAWYRFNMFWRYGDSLLPFLRKDPAWPDQDRSVNKVNDRHRQEMTSFIKAELGDRTDLIAKCVPSYPPYGKRILLDNGWYRTLRKPNVELVDTPIARLLPDDIETCDGVDRPTDVLVMATGFKVTELAARMGIAGRGGQTLAEAWADDNPTAYLGLCVPGFPNFFCMIGPNSGPGHGGSVIFQAECQTRFIAALLVRMIEDGTPALDVRREVHDDYVRRVDAEHEQMIWTHPGMTTYYRNKHGRVFSVMPWRFVDYWAMTHEPNREDFAAL